MGKIWDVMLTGRCNWLVQLRVMQGWSKNYGVIPLGSFVRVAEKELW